MDRDHLHKKFFVWLFPLFPLTYSNPQNALIVPFETTRVVVDSEPLASGRSAVTVRASILMDLVPSPSLLDHVAMNCSRFMFGSYYLFRSTDDLVDLDYSHTVMSTWLDADVLAELVTVAGNNALRTAEELRPRHGGRLANPSGRAYRTTFIGTESRSRQDVWKAVNGALETQRCLVLATAERIGLSGIGILTDGWVVINTEFTWLAGRDDSTRAITLWRVPHADLVVSRVTRHAERPTIISQLTGGITLTISTQTEEAAATMRDVLADPRDPNEP